MAMGSRPTLLPNLAQNPFCTGVSNVAFLENFFNRALSAKIAQDGLQSTPQLLYPGKIASLLESEGFGPLEALKSAPLFSGMPPDALAQLASVCRPWRLRDGEFLFHA